MMTTTHNWARDLPDHHVPDPSVSSGRVRAEGHQDESFANPK